MTKQTRKRPPLTRDRILDAAFALVDEGGLDALSMRKLGDALGVEAMSLYAHVDSKDAIIDGLVDRVTAKVRLPEGPCGWKDALAARARCAREVFCAHPWAAALLEGHVNVSEVRSTAANEVIGVLREAGFSIRQAHSAFLLLDAFIYGFVLQETAAAYSPEALPDAVAQLGDQIPRDRYPYVAEMMDYIVEEGAADMGPHFEFGLSLLLDGLESVRGAG